MTAPSVAQLPTAPARLSRPSNFYTESTLFLEALTPFRSQVNTLNTYLNAQIPNKYNLGKVNGARSFPSIFQTDLYDIEYAGNGITFSSNLDALYLMLRDYSTTLNQVGLWFDSVVAEVGTIPYDLDKPIISGISTSMVRDQAKDTFNTTATTFSETCVDNINSLYQSMWYSYITSCGNDSNGLVTDTTIISILDCGSVTDPDITY